jgi:hypothetical protein
MKTAALALLLLALVAPVGAFQTGVVPDLGPCETLEPPTDTRSIGRLYAEGVQIYRWDGTSWVFLAPAAMLYSDPEFTNTVGFHYAGPTWESINGGKVVGTVLKRCTADSSAIPWLLLGAVRNEGPGPFRRVTHIQRVNTVGGLAPSAPGEFIGALARVPYTAEYYFYKLATKP